jgi:hypothetical protein
MMIIIFWEMTPCGSYKYRRFGGSVFYESVPIQELTTSLCNLLALVHPEDGGDTSSETSVLIRATRRHLPEDDNHQYNYSSAIYAGLARISTETAGMNLCK